MDPAVATLAIHDLKNALGGLETRLVLLVSTPSTEAAQAALSECQSLRRTFVQFLMAYGVDGPMRARVNDESPAELMQALARDTALAHPQLSVHVRDDTPAPAFWYFDAHLVRMALDAALDNAARFARGHLWLEAIQDDDVLVLRVDDDGPGLGGPAREPDLAPHSTGLGTALCRQVAQAHRLEGRCGEVTLTDRPGGGTRFELRLP